MVVCSDDGRRLRTQDEGRKGGKEEGGRTDGHLDEETEGGFEVDGGTRMRESRTANIQGRGGADSGANTTAAKQD